MNVKLNQPLFLADGKSVLTDNNHVVTLKDVIISCIVTPINRLLDAENNVLERGDNEQIKAEKWKIIKRFQELQDKQDEIDFSIDELKIIKDSIAKIQPQLVSGQCIDMLQNPNIKKPK